MKKARVRIRDVIVKIPHFICYRRNGKKIEKAIQIQYCVPAEIVQQGELEQLVVSEEMAAVIYQAELEMERARKRVSEFQIGSYVEGLSEIEMAYRVDEVFEQVEYKLLAEEIQYVLEQLKPVQRRRVFLYYYLGYNTLEIAEMEETYQSNIYRSIKTAEKNSKKFLKRCLKTTLPQTNSVGVIIQGYTHSDTSRYIAVYRQRISIPYYPRLRTLKTSYTVNQVRSLCA